MTERTLSEVSWRLSAGGVPSDAWVVAAAHLRDALSDLYSASIVVAMEPGGEALDGLVGGAVLLEAQRDDVIHRFQGIVRSVEDLGTTASHRFATLEIGPALWLLSQRSDVRIFQNRNVIGVIRAVLAGAGIYQGPRGLRVDPSLEAMPEREYLVQYAESDLAFVRRLLEDEGIPFRFDHKADGGETLVLAGDEHVWPEVLTLDGVTRITDDGDATATAESVRWFDERHEMRTASVTLRDYDFSRPRASLDMTARHGAPGARLARYEYPARAAIGAYDDAASTYRAHNTARLARVRAEEHLCRVHRGRGRGNVLGMLAGTRFTLAGHERPELDTDYVVTEVVHRVSAWHALPAELRNSRRVRAMLDEAGIDAPRPDAERRYENSFRTHRLTGEASVAFRPERVTPRPVVEGPQTARVVGPPGEDIHTDPHGRIKVQFHWDREGNEDEHSSCWIRMAQSWGGGQWGFTVVPRVGMEVLVNFLEGDPDRPLATSSVYNGENKHATALPDTKTQSAIRTCSTPATGGYNEIRWEDRAGEERFYVQAERDHDTLVKHDQSITVQRHRTKLVQGEEVNTIEQSRVTHVKLDNVRRVDGNQDVEVHGPVGASLAIDQDDVVSVGRDRSLSVGRNLTERVGEDRAMTTGKDLTERVGGAHALTVAKDLTESVGGAHALTVAKDLTEKVGGAMALTVAKALAETIGGDLSVTINGLAGATFTAAAAFSVTANASVTLACGDSKIEMTRDEIKITSKTVKVKGETLTDIKGGLVKINCADPEEEKKDKKKNPIEELKKKIEDGIDKALAKLPVPLRDALKKAITGAIDATVKALASGRMPDFGAIVKGALKTVAEGALRAANELVSQGISALKGADFVQGNPILEGLVVRGEERINAAMQRALLAVQTFGEAAAETPEFNALQQSDPATTQAMLQAAGAPALDDVADLELPPEAGPMGAHVRAAMGGIAGEGLRAACAVMAAGSVAP